VGVIAPCGPASQIRADKGLQCLESLGFNVCLRESSSSERHYLAGTDDYRAAMLKEAFFDNTIDAVWCLRGGYGGIRTIRKIADEVADFPLKPFIGFSDVTSLLLYLTKTIPMVTFHGPVVTQLPDLTPAALEQTLAMLAGRHRSLPLGSDTLVLNHGTASGVLVGGNLSIVCSMVGTPYLPSLDGTLLFVEDVGEPAYRVDRMMMQLHLSGALGGVKGLILGRFTGVADGDQPSLEALWREVATWINGPVIQGLPVGHDADNITIPVGAAAELSTSPLTLSLVAPVTQE